MQTDGLTVKVKVKVKVKVTLEQAMKAQRGEQRYSSTLSSTSAVSGWWVANATSQPHYPLGRDPIPIL